MKVILILTLTILSCSVTGQEIAITNSETSGLVRYEIDHLIVFVNDTTIQTEIPVDGCTIKLIKRPEHK